MRNTPRFVLRHSNTGTREVCPITGETFRPEFGMWPFLDGDFGKPVCVAVIRSSDLVEWFRSTYQREPDGLSYSTQSLNAQSEAETRATIRIGHGQPVVTVENAGELLSPSGTAVALFEEHMRRASDEFFKNDGDALPKAWLSPAAPPWLADLISEAIPGVQITRRGAKAARPVDLDDVPF